MPLRTASTPATNVVATAPNPTINIPSFPLAAAISVGVFFCPVAIDMIRFLKESTSISQTTYALPCGAALAKIL
jgi:hypothetical protein